MIKDSPLTHCISTYNNLPYLKIAIESVRKNSYYKFAPFIIHAENCTDGTNEWLKQNGDKYGLDYYIDIHTDKPKGIGGGMNFCADLVKTEYINFLHSDFYVTEGWDLELLKIHEAHPDEELWVNSYRIEPNMFGSPQRPGTTIVPQDAFGAYHNDFDTDSFDQWVVELKETNESFEIPKGEGVSGLVKKSVWDTVGGNDPRFAPTSWDDMDLFLRMLQHGVRFVLPFNSIVWHFGARGSHRLEENDGQSSQRQKQAEQINAQKWLDKWGKMPIFNEYGMITQLQP
jgi:GT2 family glycosyltransferase|tara:strand:+ start:10570 stop:11427 length:858 start_codon:yes stop_codon:yes gene_type:complete